MRHALRSALVCLLLAPCAAAQPAVADTTDPARYFPLEVGNEWFWTVGGLGAGWYDHVVLQSEDGGVFAGERMTSEPAPGGGYTEATEPVTLRFDAGTGVVYLGDGENEGPFAATVCGLGLDFGGPMGAAAQVPCLARGGGTIPTAGGYDEGFRVGDDSFSGTVKYISDSGPCCAEASFAADVGPLRWSAFDLMPYRTLAYAKVGGVEYGEATVLDTEGSVPLPRVTSIRGAHPNPFTDAFTLTVDHPRTGTLVVEVFDTLGRRLYADRPVVPVGQTELRIQLPPGAPGVYTARIRSARDPWPARPVRVVRAR